MSKVLDIILNPLPKGKYFCDWFMATFGEKENALNSEPVKIIIDEGRFFDEDFSWMEIDMSESYLARNIGKGSGYKKDQYFKRHYNKRKGNASVLLKQMLRGIDD